MHTTARTKFFIRPINPFLVGPAMILDPAAHDSCGAAHLVLARFVLNVGTIGET